jgi:hypothetical protein
MNVKQTVAQIKDCTSIEEVNTILDLENKSEKPRSTVLKAGEKKITELTEESQEANAEKKPEAGSESSTEDVGEAKADKASKVKTAEKEAEIAERNKRIESFKRKCHPNTRTANITPFAKEFFGENFKGASTSGFNVTITLKTGEEIEIFGK